MIQTNTIVLASGSPRRRRMFQDLGIPFEVIPANIEETMHAAETPEAFARRAAEEKGQAVAKRLASRDQSPWIVAADTVVVLDNDVLQKPSSPQEAGEMLERLSGRMHHVITGWTVGRFSDSWIVDHAVTAVTFHELTTIQIDKYVATGEGMDKAGAYAIQGIGTFLVDHIQGNYFNVVGLPISHVIRALVRVGALKDYPLT